MKKFNWEVLVAAIAVIVVLVLAWGDIQSDVGELRGEFRSELNNLRGDISIIKSVPVDPETETVVPAKNAAAD